MRSWCLLVGIVGLSLMVSGCANKDSDDIAIATCPGERFCRADCRGNFCRKYCYADGRDVGQCVV